MTTHTPPHHHLVQAELQCSVVVQAELQCSVVAQAELQCSVVAQAVLFAAHWNKAAGMFIGEAMAGVHHVWSSQSNRRSGAERMRSSNSSVEREQGAIATKQSVCLPVAFEPSTVSASH